MVNPGTRRYGPGYRELLSLSDGTPVELSLVTAASAPRLRRGFEALSEQSRYRRFCGERRSLSDRELRYLTEIDGENHFAIGAARPGEDGEGLAIARFVKLPGHPDVAEAAVTVIDHAQRKGLGRALVQRLVEAARERGVRELECSVIADNEPVLSLLKSLAPNAMAHEEGEVKTFVVPIADGQRPPLDLFHRLMALAGAGAVQLLSITGLLSGKWEPAPTSRR